MKTLNSIIDHFYQRCGEFYIGEEDENEIPNGIGIFVGKSSEKKEKIVHFGNFKNGVPEGQGLQFGAKSYAEGNFKKG